MLSVEMIPALTDKTAAGTRAWWDAMLELGIYIHPEDDPAEQVNATTGQRLLDDTACAKVTSIYENMFSSIGEAEACAIGVEAWYTYQGYTWDASKDEWVRQH